ncbi:MULTISPECIES: acyltransferase [unclassified Caballeronia]|uniref:acyltransferase family protein n=1 Tax=unclassified Caballeronia TaxID=2646786 RepID=UPI0028614C18|nr:MULTISPECIES: acyltransferase [unclassified Caballeronia]MDR5740580.1 acyltransferase [Caballeronia sp. LZ016]MDR5808898.1 acyltransferase [Caballeronia sp. LZ019]
MSGTPRNLELDRLRAIAALLTFYVHFHQVFYPWSFTMHYARPASLADLLGNAWAGVDLFFVISGYIISRTLVGGLDSLRHRPNALAAYVKMFYVRRIFRIMPVAWCVVAIVILCGALLNEGQYFADSTYNVQAALSIFTYTFNFWLPDNKIAQGVPLAPFWSLSVEEQFYLIFPLFMISVWTLRWRVVILVGLLAFISFFLRPYSLSDPIKVFFYTQTRCDGLIYGCLLYFASTRPWFASLRVSLGRRRHAGCALALLLSLVLGSITALDFSNTLLIPVVSILSVLLVFMAICEADLVSFPRLLQAILDCIGKRSYTLYLVHLPMFYLTTELMFRYARARQIPIAQNLWLEYTLLMLALVIVVTECLHRFVEVPMIARGKRLSASIMQREVSNAIHSSSNPEAAYNRGK